MGLIVDYRDHGCRGTFDTVEELPVLLFALPLAIGAAAAIIASAWFGGMQLLPVVMILCALALFGIRPKGSAFTAQPFSAVSLLDLLPGNLVPGRPGTGHFRIVGSWLEVRRGRRTERVFLPNARITLHDHRIRVAGTMADVEVQIIGAPGDEEDLERLRATLTQVSQQEAGSSEEVPAALRRITRTVRE